LVMGRRAGRPMRWIEGTRNRPLPTGYTGVVWREPSKRDEPVRPLVLVSREEDQRRLCGRFAQLRSDLSPLTVWCHLLTPERFEIVDTVARDADLGGYEAAWTGLGYRRGPAPRGAVYCQAPHRFVFGDPKLCNSS